jgi:hypothetical protein
MLSKVCLNTRNPAEILSESDIKHMSQLDERTKRGFLATRALSLGRHGVSLVAKASGVNRDTIYRGIHDLKAGEPLPKGRVRRAGGGNKRLLDKEPLLLEVFDDIVEAHTAGLPQDDSVKWVSLSTHQIREVFKERGIDISDYHVRQMACARGFKRRSFLRAKTFKEVKDRDAQFRKIARLTEQCLSRGIPVLSVDTKKQEMIGNFKRPGQVLCKEHPKALDHDFQTFSEGTIVPHGIYDVGTNTGYLNIGNSHDTAEFVCDNIAKAWADHLQWQYPDTDTICLLCDGGGANSYLHHIFKQELMNLAKAIQMNILVIHYPPYCSKYNPIEHRLFAPISRSWNGAPLLSAEMARERAASTKTSKGLKVYADINNKTYKTNRPVNASFEADKQKYIIFDDCLPMWNYLVKTI